MSDDQDPDEMWLYAHLTGDFGASGMPGTWKIFFDVMVGVAYPLRLVLLWARRWLCARSLPPTAVVLM